MTERSRILQVLSSLLGNAIKFCRHGDQVRVCMRRIDDQVQASVIDTGIVQTNRYQLNKVPSSRRFTGRLAGR